MGIVGEGEDWLCILYGGSWEGTWREFDGVEGRESTEGNSV